MSAEALRAYTIDRINKRIGEHAGDLIERADAPLEQMRYAQGMIAGLKEAVELQNEAYKGMGA